MESLAAEVAPFGIHTTIVNPGFFRTELLTEQSTNYAEPSIADYDERRGPLVEYWKSQNGGNPTTPPSSRERSSRLPARIRRRGVSSPAQTLLRPQSRRSLISRRRSTRTESSRRHSP
jgi:NAD(P)-dependent dehydrogenase (short-subunit alcohol dehydrogenase family)